MNFQRHDVEWSKAKIRRFWDFHSGQDAVVYFSQAVGAHVASVLRKHAGLNRASRILDYSAGTGDLLGHLLPFLRSDQRFSAADVSAESVARIRERFGSEPRFEEGIVLGDAEPTLEQGSFDLILLTEVIEHLSPEETDEILSTLRGFLRLGGRLFVTTPNQEDLARMATMCPDCGCVFHHWQHRQSWSRETLSRKMQQHGFEVERCSPIRWGPTRFHRIVFRWLPKSAPVERDGLYCIGVRS